MVRKLGKQLALGVHRMPDNALEQIQKEVAAVTVGKPEHAFALYGLGLRLKTMDYAELYRDDFLDGPDDKKVDFFNLDTETGVAIIAQDYQSQDWGKKEAPANKASDLNTAVGWVLNADIEDIPSPALAAKSQELRDAISDGSIHTIEVLYIHNLQSSQNVRNELDTVQKTLQARLDSWEREGKAPLVGVAREAGIEAVKNWRAERDTPILITDEITFKCETLPQEVAAKEWKSAFANVSADQLSALVDKYGDYVYSANLRDFLGKRASSRNINAGIEATAINQPENFWVFNNGITAITNSIEVKNGSLTCRGFSIINGAQTLGTLNTAKVKAALSSIVILMRVVQSNSQDVIQDVIRYNNTQNPIKPWELRAFDQVQTRLKDDFEKELGLTYQLRRGSSRWSAQEILFEKLAPWMSAFYGDPQTAHRNRPDIWDNDAKYARLFNNNSDVRNVLFVYRLGQAVGAVKDELRAAIAAGTSNDSDKQLYAYFRYGAFTYVIMYLCREALVAISGSKAADFVARVTVTDEVLKDGTRAISELKPLVKTVLRPLPFALKDKDAYAALKSTDEVEQLVQSVKVSLEQVLDMRPDTFDAIKALIKS